jgi:hypothetical protein
MNESLLAIVVNLVENLLFLSMIYPGFTYTPIENVTRKSCIIYIWHM